MISFSPTEEQQQLIDVIRRYAVNDVQPVAHEADEHERVPGDVVRTGWEIGLVPTAVPEELGGLGEMSALTGVLAAEEFAYGDLATALQVLSPSLFAYPVILFGTPEQKQHYLPQFLEERPAHFTAALVEPGAFFDPQAMKTTARIEGNQAVLNGEKAYVPLAAVASSILVYARDAESGRIDVYIVDSDTRGLEIGAREKLLGVRALPTHRIVLKDATVPLDCKLGGVPGPDAQVLLNRSWTALAALGVGVARYAFEYARDYAKQRVQFGVPIAQKQAIAFMLAEMAIEVDAARLMVWEAAWKLDRGEDATREAYLARQYSDKAAMFVTDSAVQVLGGYGFIREYPVERLLRNVRGLATFDGLAII
ncbi:MAG: acyl-CoA dehydrogenase family protein [Chloroflexi bacterium]|nr:acyl-CoA dehydrogenase family protein [Chloroflexota bacterium]